MRRPFLLLGVAMVVYLVSLDLVVTFLVPAGSKQLVLQIFGAVGFAIVAVSVTLIRGGVERRRINALAEPSPHRRPTGTTFPPV